MKYLLLGLSLLVAACSNTVELKGKAEYKCGDQVIQAELLDDNSMIIRINGVNNVLSKVAAANGERYENIATKVTFMEQNGDYYLSIHGNNYPVCREIER